MFPELERLETKEERRALYRAAYKKVFRGPRHWLFLTLGNAAVAASVAVLFVLL